MTKGQVKHILDQDRESDCGEKLHFLHAIDSNDGKIADYQSTFTPDDFCNVNHICGNIYYAWDTDAPECGVLYLGEFK